MENILGRKREKAGSSNNEDYDGQELYSRPDVGSVVCGRMPGAPS